MTKETLAGVPPEDSSSVVDRNQAIENMRKRVEAQLAALVQGDDFDQLRQQVASLRTSSTPDMMESQVRKKMPDHPKEERSEIPKDDDEQPSRTRMDVNRSNSLGISDKDLEAVERFANNQAKMPSESDQDDDDDVKTNTTFVTEYKVIDPYGDEGLYTGDLSTLSKRPHGFGTMTYEDGRLFQGGWVHGQWHGKGTAVFANGDKFDGNYDLDRRHGFGVYEWKDGRVYEGEFHMDQRQGVGEYRWPDGAIYRGEFMSGHRQGEGTYTFSDGSTYTGEWLKGRYHGVGQCIWKDGRVYKGEWLDGKAHGYGIEKRANGLVRHEGMWSEDRPIRKKSSS